MFNRRLLSSALKYRSLFLAVLLIGYLGGAAVITQAWGISTVINSVFLAGSSFNDIQNWLIALLIIIIIRGLFKYLETHFAKKLANLIKSDLRNDLFDFLLNGKFEDVEMESGGEISNTIMEGVDSLDAYFSQYLPQLFFSASLPLTLLLVVFPLDVLTGFVFLLTMPLIPVFMILIGRWADSLTKKRWKILSRLSAHFLDVMQGLTALKLLGQSRKQVRSIRDFSKRFAESTLEVLRVAFLSALVLELVSTISTAVVAVEIGLRLLYGRIAFQEAFFILILAPEFYLPMRLLGTRFHAGIEGTAAAERIFRLLNKEKSDINKHLHLETDEFEKIEFSNISAEYPGRDLPAVQKVDLSVEKGEKIAFIGRSGSGKTTLIKLFLGLQQPSSGEILLNGRPLESQALQSWQKQISWLPQQPHIFYGPLRHNLTIGLDHISDREIQSVLEWVQLREFVNELPEGLNTIVGERGFRLSGGQRQRIALARAALRPAEILVWDEPANSLDPGFELLLRESLETRFSDRTQLVIAHRLSTIEGMDRIIFMADGRISAQGTHSSLLASYLPYQKLFDVYSKGSSR